MNTLKISFLFFILLISCSNQKAKNNCKTIIVEQKDISEYDTTTKTAHILVALCDNKYQGIVPVPEAIGNGEDYNKNLYWGCSYGIRSFFKGSKNWNLISKSNLDSVKLERLVFKHKSINFYLVCDAYRGKNIKDCTIDFLNSAAGIMKDTIKLNNTVIGINGNANLLTYIGHDGLMDFELKQTFNNVDKKQRDIVILACKSRKFFTPYIKQAIANPILWTSDLMCPEAYTIHDLLEVYLKNPKDINGMNNAAAQAYSKYQKCSLKASKNLLVSGF